MLNVYVNAQIIFQVNNSNYVHDTINLYYEPIYNFVFLKYFKRHLYGKYFIINNKIKKYTVFIYNNFLNVKIIFIYSFLCTSMSLRANNCN